MTVAAPVPAFKPWPPLFFASGSAALDEAGLRMAAALAESMPKDERLLIRIEGFADRAGPAAYNRELSCRRSRALAAEFVKAGISPARQRLLGYGEEEGLGAAAGEDGVADPLRRIARVGGTSSTYIAPDPRDCRLAR